MLIDVAVTNPLSLKNGDILTNQGAGGPATAYQQTKVDKYRDLDFDRYEYLPFVVETCGVGDAAKAFCKELRKRRVSKSCIGSGNQNTHSWWQHDILLTAINVEIQRFNSQMILERNPVTEALLEPKLVKCTRTIAKRKEKAIETLNRKSLRAQKMITVDPVIDKSSTDQGPSKPQRSNSESIVNREGEQVRVKQSKFQLEKPAVPPDPSDTKVSIETLRDCESPRKEHSSATKKYSYSQEMSTSSTASVSIAQSDWRKNQKKVVGLRIPWEPPERPMKDALCTSLLNSSDTMGLSHVE